MNKELKKLKELVKQKEQEANTKRVVGKDIVSELYWMGCWDVCNLILKDIEKMIKENEED